MKKRLLAGMLVLCMVLALGLTACSGTDATTTTTTTAAEGTTPAGDGETTTAAGADGETTAEGETAPATWENLSWEKDTSPVTFSCYIDYDWYMVDTWGEDEVSKAVSYTHLDVYKRQSQHRAGSSGGFPFGFGLLWLRCMRPCGLLPGNPASESDDAGARRRGG